MIFNIPNHIDQIINGTKTQTRRDSGKYQVGKTYAIQPARGKPGDPRGRIYILHKWVEPYWRTIHPNDALEEGGYSPQEYEELYNKIHPEWAGRWVYKFKFVLKAEDQKDE